MSRCNKANTAYFDLKELMSKFIGNHPDILESLRKISLIEVKNLLDEIQFEELKNRISEVLTFAELK